MKVRKAIIPAAGLGTRFLPATKAQPKEMLPIVDKPAIQYIIEEAIKSGIEEILIITGRSKRAIEDHFDRSIELECELEKKEKIDQLDLIRDIANMANIHYIRQKEPKGLGHAILCAKSFVGNEPFAVLLGDDIVDSQTPCLKQLIDLYEKYKTTILGVQMVDDEQVDKYGIVDGIFIDNGIYKINNLVEKPNSSEAPSNIAILGRYIITPEIFEILSVTDPGSGGEIQLTDALKKLTEIQNIYAYEFEGRRYDIGNKLGFLEATIEFALKRDDIKKFFRQYLIELVKSNYEKIEIKQ
ncbi:UTP--glucose-1-phosphate uridylyltransferase GalU [Paenibacillus ehimensis]|uniref:UTP--glucose-1-phosphate uridylyltransferase n=1 Tax=Paenibacillus ehimensis TaxID=79264 RepID=A0ABT8VH39_9BACL|nr:UTP--glucose-1-phosphate uridylyltransferase GalU [Paenibacillus ehimensis]MDO3680293.1 UTP--glucose-1-phosphate uridylyltransferase GalU [Paenibacillus ehimensis]